MKTLFEPFTLGDLAGRLDALDANASRLWGRMSVESMVCHLSDAFLMVLGDRPSQETPSLLGRTLLRFVALHTPVPWPKGARAPDIVNQDKEGSPPGDFLEDKRRLRALMERFSAEAPTRSMFHPIFGELSSEELGRWGFRHIDHHLRQFGA